MAARIFVLFVFGVFLFSCFSAAASPTPSKFVVNYLFISEAGDLTDEPGMHIKPGDVFRPRVAVGPSPVELVAIESGWKFSLWLEGPDSYEWCAYTFQESNLYPAKLRMGCTVPQIEEGDYRVKARLFDDKGNEMVSRYWGYGRNGFVLVYGAEEEKPKEAPQEETPPQPQQPQAAKPEQPPAAQPPAEEKPAQQPQKEAAPAPTEAQKATTVLSDNALPPKRLFDRGDQDSFTISSSVPTRFIYKVDEIATACVQIGTPKETPAAQGSGGVAATYPVSRKRCDTCGLIRKAIAVGSAADLDAQGQPNVKYIDMVAKCKRDVLLATTTWLNTDTEYEKALSSYEDALQKISLSSEYVVLGSKEAGEEWGAGIDSTSLADPYAVKGALDRVIDLTDPEYVIILGSASVFPQFTFSEKGDVGTLGVRQEIETKQFVVYSDDPYVIPLATSGARKFGWDALPQRIISRFPDGSGSFSSSFIAKQLRNAASSRARLKQFRIFADSCGTEVSTSCMGRAEGLRALALLDASAECLDVEASKETYDASECLLSPLYCTKYPRQGNECEGSQAVADIFSSSKSSDLVIAELHGRPSDLSSVFPYEEKFHDKSAIFLSVKSLPSPFKAPGVFFSGGCKTGLIQGVAKDDSLVLRFLDAGSRAVFAPTSTVTTDTVGALYSGFINQFSTRKKLDGTKNDRSTFYSFGATSAFAECLAQGSSTNTGQALKCLKQKMKEGASSCKTRPFVPGFLPGFLKGSCPGMLYSERAFQLYGDPTASIDSSLVKKS